jgi:hypothetical protein
MRMKEFLSIRKVETNLAEMLELELRRLPIIR